MKFSDQFLSQNFFPFSKYKFKSDGCTVASMDLKVKLDFPDVEFAEFEI